VTKRPDDAKARGMGPDLPMPSALDVRPNLELDPWTDLRSVPFAGQGTVQRIGLLPGGTTGGRPSIAMIVRLSDGRQVLAETTWALMETAVRALAASPVAELDRLEHP
jgi:hypothetical protein